MNQEQNTKLLDMLRAMVEKHRHMTSAKSTNPQEGGDVWLADIQYFARQVDKLIEDTK